MQYEAIELYLRFSPVLEDAICLKTPNSKSYDTDITHQQTRNQYACTGLICKKCARRQRKTETAAQKQEAKMTFLFLSQKTKVKTQKFNHLEIGRKEGEKRDRKMMG
jgi:hypothetical protein